MTIIVSEVDFVKSTESEPKIKKKHIHVIIQFRKIVLILNSYLKKMFLVFVHLCFWWNSS